MKRTYNLSPYAQELISSGRGDRLIKDFYRRILIIKQSRHKIPKGHPNANRRERIDYVNHNL